MSKRAKETGIAITDVPGGMNDDRFHALEELGFVWALRGEGSDRYEGGELTSTPNR
jgi:hypothetical protein